VAAALQNPATDKPKAGKRVGKTLNINCYE